ncbi:hypothetical protein BCR33DRAFT_852205 [Rhizoclosmatium globosum]|uniref:BZIP domain-containing protein n=1 Tax=Rhizoclosmatium globosum TaxID=329046 RepID=A0A1Y2C3V3_9FUNG|nr:hypothetical protein BCR33DRAFT_852205 [Rhizoclosmatium globosum]|eukprot:ORY41720.1 hypothetical protein BCR33DRAFT_852205 [Rhizoclosmatium globosum]
MSTPTSPPPTTTTTTTLAAPPPPAVPLQPPLQPPNSKRKGGRRPTTAPASTRRQEQIRAAQRRFAEKQRATIAALEAKAALFDDLADKSDPLKVAAKKIRTLESELELVKCENSKLKLELEQAKLKSVPEWHLTCPMKPALSSSVSASSSTSPPPLHCLRTLSSYDASQLPMPTASLMGPHTTSLSSLGPHTLSLPTTQLQPTEPHIPMLNSFAGPSMCPFSSSNTLFTDPNPNTQLQLQPFQLQLQPQPQLAPFPSPFTIPSTPLRPDVIQQYESFQHFHNALKSSVSSTSGLLSRVQFVQLALKAIPSLQFFGSLVDRMCDLFLKQTSRCIEGRKSTIPLSAIMHTEEYLEMKRVRKLLLDSCDSKDAEYILSILGCSMARHQ